MANQIQFRNPGAVVCGIASLVIAVAIAIAGRPARAADAYCGPEGVKFAHCQSAPYRNFSSVVLAIHGWHGACSGTFGKNDLSLFSLLNDGRFFDWDCFDYDSDNVSIADNVALLRKRFEKLRDLGYNEMMLVTHSTGGILALHTLADRFVDASGHQLPDNALRPAELRKQITIPVIVAWATPINGLNWQITTGGKILNFFGASKEILPDLDASSAYLKNLKMRLGGMGALYTSAPIALKREMDTYVYFYQGQDNDWVVQPIDRKLAVDGGWLWDPDRGHLTDSKYGHTGNIGDAVHGFPSDVTEFITERELVVQPAFDNVFPTNYSNVLPAFDERQRLVIEAIRRYAVNNFTNAISASIEFMERMMLTSFPRSNARDLQLIEGLLSAIEIEAGKPRNLKRTGSLLTFVDKILRLYDGSGGVDRSRPGYNENPYVLRVLQLAKAIDEILKETNPAQIVAAAAAQAQTPPVTVAEVRQQGITQANLTAAFGRADVDEKTVALKIEEARTAIAQTTARLLESQHGMVQGAALAALSSSVVTLSDQSVRDAGMVEAIGNYYRDKAGNLGVSGKQAVGDTLMQIVQRKSGVSADAWAQLADDVRFRAQDVPMWLSLQNPQLTGKMIAEQREATPDVAKRIDTPEGEKLANSMVKISTDVARYVGDNGKDTVVAQEAFEARKELLNSLPEDKRNDMAARNLVEGGELDKWQNLGAAFSR